jgi:cytosolic phospholipase A2
MRLRRQLHRTPHILGQSRPTQSHFSWSNVRWVSGCSSTKSRQPPINRWSNAIGGGLIVLGGGGILLLHSNGNFRHLQVSRLRNESPNSNPTTASSKIPVAIKKRKLKSKSELDDQQEGIEEKEEEIEKDSERQVGTPANPTASEIENAYAENNSTWVLFSDKLSAVGASIGSIEWSALPDTIVDNILPEWSRTLPGYVSKLQREMSMTPGSLAEEIWDEARDPTKTPEIAWEAKVRVSRDLPPEEKKFLEMRKMVTRGALARYLDIAEAEIHPDDVPTIAMCGSGGGLRALVAGSSSMLCATESGLFDCVTYTAGVSGSCWAQAIYHSSIGQGDFGRVIQHLKSRIGIHIAFPPPALALLNTAPTNRYLLRGVVERLKVGEDWGLVDIYGLLLSTRLLVPRGELAVHGEDLKLSSQRHNIARGAHPLPIYTAVRHEIPVEETADDKGENLENHRPSKATKEQAKKEAWFQWFEMTPYELWCEELEAGIPSWSVGRHFNNGKDVALEDGLRAPEAKLSLFMGIWGSAFCATLSHYYTEVRPVLKSIIGFASLDGMIEERNEDLSKVHPIDPAAIPNYVVGMKHLLPKTCPESLFKTDHIKLMDAGMSNNLPIYPLLRPGRGVDVIIAFDASADIRASNWLAVTDGYARQRGIKAWPIGAGWPTKQSVPADNAAQLDEMHASSVQEAATSLNEAKDHEITQPHDKKTLQKKKDVEEEVGYCAVWVGSTAERAEDTEPPRSKQVQEDFELMDPSAGVAVIYMPFVPNPEVEGVDPDTSDFMSTWNFIYTPEDIDKVVALARANYNEGQERIKRTVRAVYERKKKLRCERESGEKEDRFRRKLRLGLIGKNDSGEHGDHFS